MLREYYKMFSIYLRLILVTFLLLSIHACGGGNSLTTTSTTSTTTTTTPPLSLPSLFGVAQKGSYLVDATLSFSRLSEDGKMTSEQAETKINDNFGSFAIDLAWNDWTKMTVTGLFFNEFTGKESQGVVSLDNITDIGASSGKININLFTHIVATRVQVLLDEGQSLVASKKQAIEELKAQLGLSSVSIEKLDIGSDAEQDNAILLVFSAGFLSTIDTSDKLSLALLELTDDFADNALFDGVAKVRFQKISIYAGKQGVLAFLSETLKNRGHKNPPTDKTMGVLPTWIEIDKNQNNPPIANAGSNQTIIEGQSITLEGSAVDNDGQIEAYVWTEGDIILGREKTLERIGLLVGQYTYTLTVTDDKGAQSSDVVTITVNKKITENKAPTVNAGQDKTIDEGQSITLKGVATDSDGSIQSYQWTQDGSVLSEEANLERNNLSVGRYIYTLTVTDNEGAKGEDSVTVVVKEKVVQNQLPVANAGEDQTIVEGQNITLKGSAQDTDGSIQSYQWTEDGKVLSVKETLERNNLLAGRYTYTLTVTDNEGAQDSDNVMVTVEAKPLASIKVNLSGERCTTAFGLHLRLVSTLTGGITGGGPVQISRYAAANCSGGIIDLPSALPSSASATYVITNIVEIGNRKRTATITISALSQTESTQVNIDENGNVSEQ